MRGETEDGNRGEREEVVLRKGKVECNFFAKVVFDRVQFGVCDTPLAGPRLNPFLPLIAIQSSV